MCPKIFYAVLVLGCGFGSSFGAIPSFINLCHRDDPKLEQCVINSITSLKPHLRKGIPELEVPPIEPLKLKVIPFRSGNDNTHFASNLTNVNIWDASTFDLQELSVNIPNNRFGFKVNIPTLRLEGDYDVDTKILLLELKGQGVFNINLTDFQLDCVLKGHKIKKNGDDYLEFERLKCKVDFKKSNVLFHNIFNENPVLARTTNDVINDNFGSIFEDVKPTVLAALADTFTDIANKITLNFKYSELFL